MRRTSRKKSQAAAGRSRAHELPAEHKSAQRRERGLADLDADGDVDLTDLAGLLAVYGTTCP
jgi:hypothetical protein